MAAEIGSRVRNGKGASLLARLTDLIYPPRCIACPAETDTPGGLCPDCWREIEFISGPVCTACGTPVDMEGDTARCDDCARHPRPWNRGIATVIYGGAGRRVILQLKHGDRLDIVPALSRWMARTGGELIAKADLIAPVPLHWSRLARRRYNQSAELVRHLAPAEKAAPGLLRRRHATPSLDGKRRDERASILADTIAVGSRNVSGKVILLVDDVLTTGATLSTSAHALIAAGAKEVNVLTLARVVRDRGA